MPHTKRLLFVVGLTRSGTSLLYALLNQHPQIALMYEADAVYLDNEPLSPAHFGRMDFWNGALRRHGLTGGALAGVTTARGLYACYAQAAGANICGEKSPSYCAHLQRIARRFPDASFLIIRRDFAAVYRSLLDAAREVSWWGRPGAFHRLLREQELMVRNVSELRAAGRAVEVVEYDELVREPEVAMRRMTEFLGVDFLPRLTSLHGADLSAVHPGPEHTHLQKREIEPRHNSTEIPRSRLRVIERFQARWDALEHRPVRNNARPIGSLGYAWHQSIGAGVVQFRFLVRLTYEIAPPAALRAYRKVKRDLTDRSRQPNGASARVFNAQTAFQVGCFSAILLACAVLDYCTGPDFTIAPFYLLPVLFATRRMNVVAGLLVSVVTAIAWSAVNLTADTFWSNAALLAWNSLMRTLQLALFALLIGADPGFEGEEPATRSVAAQ